MPCTLVIYKAILLLFYHTVFRAFGSAQKSDSLHTELLNEVNVTANRFTEKNVSNGWLCITSGALLNY
jgi:hypothetical protein